MQTDKKRRKKMVLGHKKKTMKLIQLIKAQNSLFLMRAWLANMHLEFKKRV